MKTAPVAVDVMGGDRGPAEIVAGARQAAARIDIPVAVVGRLCATEAPGLEVWPAGEVIQMHEDPLRGVRQKRDASALRAAEAVRDGRASAMVSAGNTGAVVASALLRMGRIPGVVRPAVAVTIPAPHSTPTVLVDAGANASCHPRWLLQFAQMGAVYAAHRLRKPEPLVGLLSIGAERGKGNNLVRSAHALLEHPGSLPQGRFVGNVEGHEILTERVDVVVTEGFTGNVVLKAVEGSFRAVLRATTEALDNGADRLTGSSEAVLAPLRSRLDPATYGGAMLLGVNGVCIIAHGSSSARAIANAVQLAADLAAVDVVGAIRTSMSTLRHRPGQDGDSRADSREVSI